jgi:hypothetical protein
MDSIDGKHIHKYKITKETNLSFVLSRNKKSIVDPTREAMVKLGMVDSFSPHKPLAVPPAAALKLDLSQQPATAQHHIRSHYYQRSPQPSLSPQSIKFRVQSSSIERAKRDFNPGHPVKNLIIADSSLKFLNVLLNKSETIVNPFSKTGYSFGKRRLANNNHSYAGAAEQERDHEKKAVVEDNENGTKQRLHPDQKLTRVKSSKPVSLFKPAGEEVRSFIPTSTYSQYCC